MHLQERADVHAALADPIRLAIIDALALSDRSPGELAHLNGLASNLLAHHLGRLAEAGLVRRVESAGDRRRRYVQLTPRGAGHARPTVHAARRALFLCSHNSARSQLAAALWASRGGEAESAGTQPAERVHPGAVAAGARAGLDLSGAQPRHVGEVRSDPDIVVTVCDLAHEELVPAPAWLHWSIPDPADSNDPTVFDTVVSELSARIDRIRRDAL